MKTKRLLPILFRLIAFQVIIVFASFLWVNSVFADYVLPYPSYMPGNKAYKITRLVDTIKQYWYFGNIAQIKYHMALSDKYLVEAKTLFEYNQYLLAMDALQRSSIQFSQIYPHLAAAKKEGKDISIFESMLRSEAEKHMEVLRILMDSIPQEFTWTPEKSASVELNIRQELEKSLQIRQSVSATEYL